MVKVGREIMEGKGLCLTCHTIGKTGALRFPDLAGIGARAKSRVPGMSDVEYLAQSLYEPDAFVVPGFNPAMPAINQPPIGLTDQEILCVIAYLQTLGGTPTVTLQTTHRYYGAAAAPGGGAAPRPPAPAPRRRAAPGARARRAVALTRRQPTRRRRHAPASAGSPEQRCTMNILVVLAVAAVFGLLRFRRANLLMWAGAWWVGIYVLLRFGFTAPIPSSVVSLYMGIVSIAILAYVSSSEERREEVSRPLVRFMTEKRYTALLGATVVAIPALAAANVYVQMNVPLEPPFFPRTVHPASPTEITVHDKKIDLDAGENPFLAARDVESGRVPQTCRERAPGLLPELRLLPRRQPGRQRHVRARAGPDPDQLRRQGDDRECCARRFSSGGFPREAPGCPKKGVPGTRPCPPGRSS